MIKTFMKQFLATVLSVLVVITTTPLEVAAQQTGYSGQGVSLSSEELQGLVGVDPWLRQGIIGTVAVGC